MSANSDNNIGMEETSYHVDTIANHFEAKGLVIKKITDRYDHIHTLAVLRNGKVMFAFHVTHGRISKNHLLTVVRDYTNVLK